MLVDARRNGVEACVETNQLRLVLTQEVECSSTQLRDGTIVDVEHTADGLPVVGQLVYEGNGLTVTVGAP